METQWQCYIVLVIVIGKSNLHTVTTHALPAIANNTHGVPLISAKTATNKDHALY
jgi:hypothetical protein